MAERRRFSRGLGIVIGGVLLTLLAQTANALSRHDELEASWREYASRQASVTPAYTFPHAACFRVAALEHDLPESLLLAVARGESDFEALPLREHNILPRHSDIFEGDDGIVERS